MTVMLDRMEPMVTDYSYLMDWSYVAGFFDGEGSVIIYKDKRRVGKADTYIRLQIGQTDLPTHEAICSFLESQGILYTTFVDKSRNRLGYKTCYFIKVGRRTEIAKFCSAILPYSITKRSKLEEALNGSTGCFRALTN